MFARTSASLLFAALSGLVPALTSAQDQLSLDDVAQVTLLPGWRTADGTHMAAIRISMAKGWKTYWRSPGASGIPAQFDWSGSQNLKDVTVHWPTPTVFDPDGSRSYGYEDVVVVPIELIPASADAGDITVLGELNIGVCAEICVPMSVSLQGVLPVGGTPSVAITESLANRPQTAAQAGLTSAACSVEPISDGLRLSAQLTLPEQGGDEVVVFELPDKSIWIAEATSLRNGNRLSADTEMVPASAEPFPLDMSQLRITVFGDDGVVDIQGCATG